MKKDSFPWTKLWKKPFCVVVNATRQHQRCLQTHTFWSKQTTTTAQKHSNNMAPSVCRKNSFSMIPIFVAFLVVASSLGPVLSLPLPSNSAGHRQMANDTFDPTKEIRKLRRISAFLKKINKPAVKTIQSPDGDVIDCVLSHLQPAFDHPALRGQKPLDPPARPKGHNFTQVVAESFQLWSDSGESCPEGTVPIRRTTAKDILRASSIRRYGRRRLVRRDSTGSGHEHAVVFVNGDQYYGAKASLNVWAPRVTNEYEFSLSQIWVISGSFGNDLNTIEAGWQVSPELYGDNYPRFFTYWTTDAYQATGCYNLLCSGFVQSNNKIAIGAAISPRSSYSGRQFDIGLMVWKDPKHGHWWLEFGPGLLVGYWPAYLFSHLRSHADMIQFGGEIVNSRSLGFHTSTQMGSGHFAGEGFGKVGILAIEHADFDGIERLALVTGGEIASTFDNPESVKLGHCKLIEEIMIGEDKLIHFSGVEMGQACTIVLRGASHHVLDEAERSLHDALCVLSQTVNDTRVLLGGGWPEMVMAKEVDELARKTPGKKSHAIEAFSRALVAIPTIIADNAGLDSADLVARLRAEHHKEGCNAGIDVISGSVGDMAELGISESFKVKQAVLLSATEAAEMILRVDEIIKCAPRRREDRM